MNEDNLADDFFDEALGREIDKSIKLEADHAANILYQTARKIGTTSGNIVRWYARK